MSDLNETLPGIQAAIALTASLLRGGAGRGRHRRSVQRMHIAMVARHIADHLYAASKVPAEGEDQPLDLLVGEFAATEIAPFLFASHGLGANAMSEDECRAAAAQAYLDRLHDLTVGGMPWGRA